MKRSSLFGKLNFNHLNSYFFISMVQNAKLLLLFSCPEKKKLVLMFLVL